jgi:hypothetical protein
MDGRYRTDATFWRAGRKSLHPVTVRRWSYLPGWKRSGIRLAVTVGNAGVYALYKFYPVWTVVGLALGGLSAAVYAVLAARRAWRRRMMHRGYEQPLHAVLGPLLGLPMTQRATDYITVPPSYRDNEATPVVINLPDSFAPTPANRQQLSDVVLPKLGLNEDNTDVVFRTVGNPVMHCKMAPQPPNSVLWADCLDVLEGLKPGQIFVGLGARNKPYIRDYTAGEQVHGGFSVQTGRGKSSAMMAWVAQALHNDQDVLVTVIDPKQSALPTCLVGVPGYRLANDPDNVLEMWDAIVAFETEMDRRRLQRLNDPTLEFPLMYLYLDELSEFADMTRETWEIIREDSENKSALPKKAPVWRSISRILRMSREYGGRVNVFTQRLDNASTGGIGLRDLFGERGLGGYKRNQWMMLVGTLPMPKPSSRRGRWIYTDGNKELWVQNVYATEQELRDWALAGRRPVDIHGGHSPVTAPSPGDSDPSVQWDIVGLQAGADYLGIPVGTFRKRRQRAGGIPGEGVQGRSPVWMKTDLDAFAAKQEVDA